MTLKTVYLGLSVLGTIAPLFLLFPFVEEHGLDIPLMVSQLFATPVGSFVAADVIVSSAALWVFVIVEARRLGMKHQWLPLAATLAVGVSLALPLFLYMREAWTSKAHAWLINPNPRPR